MPIVSCPYGCSEYYLHKGNFVSLDTHLNDTFQKLDYDYPQKAKTFLKLRSLRDDYIHDHGDEDTWLLNPHRNVMPTISLNEDGIPQTHTCQHHKESESHLWYIPVIILITYCHEQYLTNSDTINPITVRYITIITCLQL